MNNGKFFAGLALGALVGSALSCWDTVSFLVISAVKAARWHSASVPL